MSKWIDLTGQRYGRLTVIERDFSRKGNHAYWLCKCECGNTKSIKSYNLRSGATQSCGCLHFDVVAKNIAGQRFGKLTVIEKANRPNKPKSENHVWWKCLCDCGNVHIVRGSNLIRGNVQSCGCLIKETNTKHGMRHTPIYNRWLYIKARCFYPKNPKYKNYGARGITMCDSWRNSFEEFYNYVSKLPHFGEKGYTLNRIDNDGNYEPNNVEWADDIAQSNNKRNNHLMTYNGKTQTIAQWARELGINKHTLQNRILTCKWSVERALTENVGKKRTSQNITFNGKTQSLTQWAKELGMDRKTLHARIQKLNWPIERALTEKVKER